MAYRYDGDLEFLASISSEDLGDLVYLLTYDKDNSARLTEALTLNDKYKKYYPNHHKYWEEIAGEIQCFGANTFATLFRGGKGVLYREVLTDVCDKLKVNYNKNSSAERIENCLLMKILEEALNDMSEKELKDLSLSIGEKNIKLPNAQTMTAIFQAIFRAGGFNSYKLTVIIANAVTKTLIGRGLSFAGNKLLNRTMSILVGPIGLAITSIWTAVDISGPAYRVTIPAVIQVAALRQKHLYDNLNRQANFS